LIKPIRSNLLYYLLYSYTNINEKYCKATPSGF
jgi:hypothetical protein